MFICAGGIEKFPFATDIGIGLINSSINLTRLCLFDKPDFLIFIGSAGSYGKHKIFDIIETSSASNIEHSFLLNKSYTPIDNVVRLDNNDIVNSSNYILTDDILAKKYLNLNITLENMEFFSVLKVAKEFNIFVKGIFVITNYTSANAHNEFIKNQKKAYKILIDYIKDKYGIIK